MNLVTFELLRQPVIVGVREDVWAASGVRGWECQGKGGGQVSGKGRGGVPRGAIRIQCNVPDPGE